MLTPSHGGNIRAMAALSGHDPAHPDKLLDFSVNVRPTGPPEYLIAALWRAMNDLTAYPDPHADAAASAIAGHLGLAEKNIRPGNGSNALIHALAPLLRARLATDHRPVQVHILEPAFSEYAKAFSAFNLHHHIVPPHAQFDPDALFGEAGKIQGIFIAANPGNPSGRFVSPEVWVRLITARPDIFFVLDEAFIEYMEHGSVIPLLRAKGEHWPANVLVLRSLTKFHAIPGLRVGYAVGPAPLLADLKAATPEWAMNTLALAAIHAVMKFPHAPAANNEVETDARQTREANARNREHLSSLLNALPGVETVPSTANYVLFRVSGTPAPDQLAVRLARETGILLRDCANYPGLEGSRNEHWFRAAVRLEADHERLAHGLAAILEVDQTRLAHGPAALGRMSRRKLPPALMIQGATSDAGKSVLAAAFCRIFHQDGFSVAPFKSQNMSLYGGAAGVDAQGRPLEMARAQIMQAQAAKLAPDVRMNPVMLKPCSNTGSHVVVLGKDTGHMDARAYIEARHRLWPRITQTYDDLAAEHDIMVLEGAGSPAEINLKHGDVVNMAMARHAQAKVILAGDIDRGGLYAAFLGTFLTFSPEERTLLLGFAVNRFRGDESLLAPAHDWLLQRTGKPVLGVVPHITPLGLPEEDSLSGVGNTGATLLPEDVDAALDRLADVVRRSFDLKRLYQELALVQS